MTLCSLTPCARPSVFVGKLFQLCLVGLLATGLVACSIPIKRAAVIPAGPEVVIQEPFGSLTTYLGDAFSVIAAARDELGVTRLDLWVDDVLVLSQESPDPAGITPLILNYSLIAAQPGTFSLVARAYNAQGRQGDSLAVTVTVTAEPLDPADPKPINYIVGQEQTLGEIAQATGNDLVPIQNLNPGLADPLDLGQVVALPSVNQGFIPLEPAAGAGAALVPVLALSEADSGSLPGFQPGEGQVIGEGQPSAMFLNANPAANPPALAQSSLTPPVIISLSPDSDNEQGCRVNVGWHDQSANETGFNIYRRSKPDQPAALQVGSSPANTPLFTDDSLPGPGTYEYLVEVEMNQSGVRSVARSAPLDVVVPAGIGCTAANQIKRLYFQPITLTAFDGNINSIALWYSINDSAARRIPGEGNYWDASLIGSVSPESIPLPASAWLNPDQPIIIKIWAAGYTQDAWNSASGGPTDLGRAFDTPTIKEIPNQKSQNFFTARASGFSIDFRLWLEDVKWTGQGGTTDTIPAPTSLRVSSTSVTGRSLAWNWNGTANRIEGFILYRSYTCPGSEAANIAPRVLPASSRSIEIPFKSEPGGCTYAYWVSAYGRAGESAHSNTLNGDTESASASVKVTFSDLTVSSMTGLPGGGSVRLFVNQVGLETSDLLYVQQGIYLLKDLVLAGRKPNNTLTLNLAQNEFLTIGFSISRIDERGNPIPDGICRGFSVYPPVDSWLLPVQSAVIRSPTGGCELTVTLNGQAAVNVAGSYAAPTADLAIMKVASIGTGVYGYVVNNGPDELANNYIDLASTTYNGGSQFTSAGLTNCSRCTSSYGPVWQSRLRVQANLPQWIKLYDTAEHTGMHICYGQRNVCPDGCPLILLVSVYANSNAAENQQPGQHIDPDESNNNFMILTRDILPMK